MTPWQTDGHEDVGNMLIPESLITALAGGQVVPFVGSGVSLSVRRGLFPTWPELLGRLADRLDADAKPKPAQVVRLFTEMGQLNKAADEALDLLGNADFAAVMQNARCYLPHVAIGRVAGVERQ